MKLKGIIKMENHGNKYKDKNAKNTIENVVRYEAAFLYPATQMDDGLMPRCTPANLAGGEYSTYPANVDDKNKKKDK